MTQQRSALVLGATGGVGGAASQRRTLRLSALPALRWHSRPGLTMLLKSSDVVSPWPLVRWRAAVQLTVSRWRIKLAQHK